MVRDFKSGGHTGQVELRRFGPSEGFQLSVFVTGGDMDADDIAYRFSPDSDLIERSPSMFAKSGDYTGFLVSASFDSSAQVEKAKEALSPEDDDSVLVPVDPYARAANEKAATGLWVTRGLGDPVWFQTGSMLGPMMLMRECTDRLVSSWGYDPVSYHKRTREAEPIGLAQLAREVQENYPKGPDRSYQNGLVRLRLDIGEDGKVKGCQAQSELAADRFYKTACDIMQKRAKFLPALDENGVPMASFYNFQITYLGRWKR